MTNGAQGELSMMPALRYPMEFSFDLFGRDAQRRVTAYSRNLSKSGMGLCSPWVDELRPGETMTAVMELQETPFQTSMLRVNVRVIWVRGLEFGLEILGFQGEDRSMYERLISVFQSVSEMNTMRSFTGPWKKAG